MRNFLLYFILLGVFQFSYSQELNEKKKFWLVFKDKITHHPTKGEISAQTLQNRQLLDLPLTQASDLPIAQEYLQKLKTLGIEPIIQSKWLNAISVYLTDNQKDIIHKLDFIQEIIPISNYSLLPSTKICALTKPKQNCGLSFAIEQIGGEALQKAGLSGKNVAIGIIDVGFAEADKAKNLSHLFDNQRIIKQKDFVNPKNKKFFRAQTAQDWHGREVWEKIAGLEQMTRKPLGFAPNAKFYLARTDHGTQESRSEEDNWVAAIEWLDSLGVRLVNTSLGYAHSFSNPKEDYLPQQMNGKTTLISRVAQIATQEKGMILVVSAGNEGDNPQWKIITAPADAEGVITVGANQSSVRAKMYYSSIGADFLPYLKPDITCYADLGTSFSAPMITGMIACLLEKTPNLKPLKVKSLLTHSAHLYPYANNYLGYGIPQANTLLSLLDNPTQNIDNQTIIKVKGAIYELKDLPCDLKYVVLFHKKDTYFVNQEEKIKITESKLTIQKPQNTQRTTIDLGKEIREIVWEE